MKYLPTIDLWGMGVQEAIYSGRLKLQRGQWMICGANNSHRCRFVGANEGHINVVHHQGNSKDTNDLFMRRVLQNRSK